MTNAEKKKLDEMVIKRALEYVNCTYEESEKNFNSLKSAVEIYNLLVDPEFNEN